MYVILRGLGNRRPIDWPISGGPKPHSPHKSSCKSILDIRWLPWSWTCIATRPPRMPWCEQFQRPNGPRTWWCDIFEMSVGSIVLGIFIESKFAAKSSADTQHHFDLFCHDNRHLMPYKPSLSPIGSWLWCPASSSISYQWCVYTGLALFWPWPSYLLGNKFRSNCQNKWYGATSAFFWYVPVWRNVGVISVDWTSILQQYDLNYMWGVSLREVALVYLCSRRILRLMFIRCLRLRVENGQYIILQLGNCGRVRYGLMDRR